MCGEILHIYGPLSIRGFGLMIVIGLLVVTALMLRHPLRKKIMSVDRLLDTLWLCVVVGMIGGRIAFVLADWSSFDHWWEFFAVWQGGFSLLGSIIGVLLVVPWYLRAHHVPVLPFLDLIALHGFLLQSISRLGCFLAGCCYGAPTTMAWGVMGGENALCVRLHPAQLYSSAALLILFFVLRYAAPRLTSTSGQTLMLYLMLAGAERFILDFIRGDREFFAYPALGVLSIYQWIAGLLILVGAVGFFILSRNSTRRA